MKNLRKEKMENNYEYDSDIDTTVLELGPHDVICGRHKESFRNIGNRRFRIIVSTSLLRYSNRNFTRKQKSQVIRDIIASTKDCGGRFLRQESDGAWIELSGKEAREKVGHALRDMAMAKHMNTSNSIGSHSSRDSIRSIKKMNDGNQSKIPTTISIQSTTKRVISIANKESNSDIDWEPLDHRRLSLCRPIDPEMAAEIIERLQD